MFPEAFISPPHPATAQVNVKHPSCDMSHGILCLFCQ